MIKKDWIAGFAICVGYFELYGVEKIKKYFKSSPQGKDVRIRELKEKCDKNDISKMSAHSIVTLLQRLAIINKKIGSKMHKVIDKRNDLLHPLRKGIKPRFPQNEQITKRLLEDSMICIKILTGELKKKQATQMLIALDLKN